MIYQNSWDQSCGDCRCYDEIDLKVVQHRSWIVSKISDRKTWVDDDQTNDQTWTILYVQLTCIQRVLMVSPQRR